MAAWAWRQWRRVRQASASASQGLLCGVEDLPGLGFCRLAEGELLAGTLLRSLRGRALRPVAGAASACRHQPPAAANNRAREQRGAAGEQRLIAPALRRRRQRPRLRSRSVGVGFSLGEAGDGFRQRPGACVRAGRHRALRARSLGAQRGCGEVRRRAACASCALCCALLCIKRHGCNGRALSAGSSCCAQRLGQLHAELRLRPCRHSACSRWRWRPRRTARRWLALAAQRAQRLARTRCVLLSAPSAVCTRHAR